MAGVRWGAGREGRTRRRRSGLSPRVDSPSALPAPAVGARRCAQPRPPVRASSAGRLPLPEAAGHAAARRGSPCPRPQPRRGTCSLGRGRGRGRVRVRARVRVRVRIRMRVRVSVRVRVRVKVRVRVRIRVRDRVRVRVRVRVKVRVRVRVPLTLTLTLTLTLASRSTVKPHEARASSSAHGSCVVGGGW